MLYINIYKLGGRIFTFVLERRIIKIDLFIQNSTIISDEKNYRMKCIFINGCFFK